MNSATNVIVSIVTGIIGLAIIAVIVSRNAQTGNVISSTGSALAGLINAAVSPVTGGTGSQAVTSALTNSGTF